MWTAIFTGIGEISTSFFNILPGFIKYIDLLFITIGCFGIIYWIYYEYYVNRGGDNFLSKK